MMVGHEADRQDLMPCVGEAESLDQAGKGGAREKRRRKRAREEECQSSLVKGPDTGVA